MQPHEGRPTPTTTADAEPPRSGLEKALGSLSILTLAMTVPQVVAVWGAGPVSGVSAWSWGAYLLSACLWLVHGLRQRDRAIWLPCIAWIALDAAIVVGVVVRA